MKIILRINKREVNYLTKHGVKYGENGIISSTGHHKSWYVTESSYVMRLLNELNKSRIVEK